MQDISNLVDAIIGTVTLKTEVENIFLFII